MVQSWRFTLLNPSSQRQLHKELTMPNKDKDDVPVVVIIDAGGC